MVPKGQQVSGKVDASKAGKHIARVGANAASDLQYRLTADLTNVNEALTAEYQISLPTPEQVKDFICDKITSSCDLADGYTHVEIAPESRPYLGMYAGTKLLVYSRLPQGLKSSGAVFTRALDCTFTDDILTEWKNKYSVTKEMFPYDSYSNFTLRYLDDILIATTSKENHFLQTRK